MATVKQLDKLPIFAPYVSSYHTVKTKNGLKEVGSPTLKRYYSSIDAEVYFGNEYVEDVCDINFVINQHTQPLYGFNSYIPDEIAQGARSVQGSFAIRFISPNYLFKLLEAAKAESITNMTSYVMPTHERTDLEIKGSVNKDLQTDIILPEHDSIWKQTFDIDVAIGGQSEAGTAQHYIITGVKILSCTSGMSASSPVPVTEIYNFVAKDIETDA